MEKEFLEFSRIDAYEFESEDNLTFFEFHIDYHECFSSEWKEDKIPEVGGKLSVRKEKK